MRFILGYKLRRKNMRLWHQELISKLPRQQLLGQHHEIAALRGNGWGKSMLQSTMFSTILPTNCFNFIILF